MSKWTKHINPKIDPYNIDLLKGWAVNKFNGQGRCKVREHNGDLIVKVKGKMIEDFHTMWIETTPSDAIVIPTNQFFDETLIDEEVRTNSHYYAVKEFMFSKQVSEMPEEELVAWFNKKHEGYNVTGLTTMTKHWVSSISDNYSMPMNIFDEVFLFYFETEADKVHFKLRWG